MRGFSALLLSSAVVLSGAVAAPAAFATSDPAVVQSEELAAETVLSEGVVEEPVAEEPVAEETVAETPVVEEPAVEEPAVEEPVLTEDVTEEPVVEEPVAEVEEVVEPSPVAEADEVTDLAASVELEAGPFTQYDLEYGSLIITGSDFPAETAVTLTIGEYVLTDTTDVLGLAYFDFSGKLEPGTHAVTMSAGGVTASSELVIEAGGYTPEFFWLEEEMYQWDLARAGQEIQAHGFSANVPIQVTLDGNLIGNFTTTSGSDVPWENGALDFVLASDVAPGEHTLLLTTAEATLSATVTVLDDAAYRTMWLDEFGMAAPYGGINRFAVTVSELAAEPVIMEGKNFPGNTMVDVYVNGVRVDTVPDGGWDQIKYPLQGLEVGPVNVQLVHPVGSVEGNFTVVPDEPGTSPAAGDYFGVSHQKISGDPLEWPLAFAVTSDGLLTGLSGQYFWQCRNMDGVVTGEAMMDFAASGFPATRITVDRPFEISWSDGTGPFTMRGIVNSDGTASGQLTAYPFECGYFEFDWATSFDGELPGTEDPGTEDPGTEDPGTEDPGTEDPGTEDPGTEDPGTEDPGTEDPGTEDPGTEDPGTEDPGTEDPGTEDPGTEDPDSEEPGTEKPGTDKPDTEEPGEKPGTEKPGTEKPSADEPEDDSDELAQTGGTSKWGYGLAALLSITAGGALLLSRRKAIRRI